MDGWGRTRCLSTGRRAAQQHCGLRIRFLDKIGQILQFSPRIMSKSGPELKMYKCVIITFVT